MEILASHFIEKADEELDQDIIVAIDNLYTSGKLTDRNLTNALSVLREDNDNGKA